VGKARCHILYIFIISVLAISLFIAVSRSSDFRDDLERAETRVRIAREEQQLVAGKLTEARKRVGELESSLEQAEGTIEGLEHVAVRLGNLFDGSEETLGDSGNSLERIRKLFAEGDSYIQEGKDADDTHIW